VRDYEDRQADWDTVNLTSGIKDNSSWTGGKVWGIPQDDKPGYWGWLFRRVSTLRWPGNKCICNW